MSAFDRKQSFIKHSLNERKKHQINPHDSFIHSSIFSFTKALINRAPKSVAISNNASEHRKCTSKQIDTEQVNQDRSNKSDNSDQKINAYFSKASSPINESNHLSLIKTKIPLNSTLSSNLSNLKTEHHQLPIKMGLSKSVSLQIKDEMKAIPKNRLLHQSSSSGSSTPADLFSLAEKGRVATTTRPKHKLLINNKIYQQPAYTELVNQIQNHEDAINREYLLHQLNPNQYHSMNYYKRLERQNCLNGDRKSIDRSNKKQMITKQDTSQSNSSNQDNSNEFRVNSQDLTSSSSNLSCSECCSLDTEEELTLPFLKKSSHCQPNLTLRSKKPLKLSSSLEKNNNSLNLTKQCSSDSNDQAMVGLLNENLIKRQFANGTYLKLRNDRFTDKLSDKLSDKRKRILGRRLTNQNSFNSFSASSSFNNSSNNSSFDHDDMLVQFTNHQTNSFSSTDNNNHFHHSYNSNLYENNSIHSNDTSSSSNSSCGHRHAERNKTINLNEFNSLNLCDVDSNQMSDLDELKEQDEYCVSPNNEIHVTHSYDPTTKKLRIRICKAIYVPTKLNQDCDRCYIKLILLPNKRQKFKTTFKRFSNCKANTIDFDELFTFNRIPSDSIMSLSIKYQLFLMLNNESKNRNAGRNIGEAIIRFENKKPMQQEDNLVVYLNPLNPIPLPTCFKYNVINSDPINYSSSNHSNKKSITATNTESLSDISSICRSDSAESHHSIQLNLPELFIGLAYNATTGRLQVSIIRGSQFKSKSNKPPDTYVKCTLLSSAGREIGRNKTTVKKSQPNPVYKQTFAFPVALFQMSDVSLMISVYNKKSINRKEMLGWFSLGCCSSGEEENSHWNEMRDSKGEQICRWHILSDA